MDSVECIDMRALVHEAIQQEYCHPKGEEDDASLHGWADEMLLVEEEILRELETFEAQEQLAALEAFEAAENDDICALYEQHQLGGVSCPLCTWGVSVRMRGCCCARRARRCRPRSWIQQRRLMTLRPCWEVRKCDTGKLVATCLDNFSCSASAVHPFCTSSAPRAVVRTWYCD